MGGRLTGPHSPGGKVTSRSSILWRQGITSIALFIPHSSDKAPSSDREDITGAAWTDPVGPAQDFPFGFSEPLRVHRPTRIKDRI